MDQKSGGRVIPPLISKMSRSTIINWEKPEQIVEIWDVKQATQSLISNWEAYLKLYGEETVAEGYAHSCMKFPPRETTEHSIMDGKPKSSSSPFWNSKTNQ